MYTIKDVVKLANVSVGSVSKYLNKNGNLKEKTKVAIQEAIETLNYEPNIYAKGLKINKTDTVVLIIPSIWHPFFSELTFYIEKNLRLQNKKMILCNSEENIENEIEFIKMARQNKVDGIIAVTYSNIDEYISEKLPVVSIDRFFSKKTGFVSSDNFNGGRLAAEKLVKLGCQNLLYVGHGSKFTNDTLDRKRGFEEYCKENKINYEILYFSGEREKFERKVEEILDRKISDNSLDGVFTDTDSHALYVLEELEKREVSVPEEVQIIGFDGTKSSKREKIFLSTIRQNIEEIAKESVNMLIKIIDNRDEIESKKIPVYFLQGKTTKILKDLEN